MGTGAAMGRLSRRARYRTTGPAGRRPCCDPGRPGRAAGERIPDHPGDRGAQPRRLEAEPRLDLSDAVPTRRRGPGAGGGRRGTARFRADRRRPRIRREPPGRCLRTVGAVRGTGRRR